MRRKMILIGMSKEIKKENLTGSENIKGQQRSEEQETVMLMFLGKGKKCP